jgi:uncharacterized protein (TIGR00297 family)
MAHLRVAIAFAVAAYMARSGLKKKSLSRGGALAAFAVGFLSLAAGLRFGSVLIVFYKTSSILTKWRGSEKARLEDGHRAGGQRGAGQVFACSLYAVAIAVWFAVARGGDCALGQHRLTTFAHLNILGFFACCAGDTWASEVGIVLGLRAGGSALDDRPRLVVPPFALVPRGTNGAVSLGGTIASALGGLSIGVVYAGMGALTVQAEARSGVPAQLLIGVFGGVAGSFLDSLLGATLQANTFDPLRKVVLEGAATKGVGTGADSALVHIAGRDVLSNEQVNVVSSIATALLCGCIGTAALFES